ncbi:hypothetical protein Tco_1005397 [Tanacetum coccineum]|uniref:Uncharacterized protein n=1 Tax=Tanacetum coccineum TaxID=301880 RepID=A0ABQ5FFU7_9ASTR
MTTILSKTTLDRFENPEQKFRSRWRPFDTPSLVESNSPEFDHIFDIEEQSGEEVRETMTETMEQYMSKTRGDYGSEGVTRPTINQDTHTLSLKGKFSQDFETILSVATEHEMQTSNIEKGQYRAAGPGFYQRNNGNSSYPDRRPSLEESLTKFMAESAKRHKENSNIIKEIRASINAAIRNQGASIKTLEIQIGQMSKVLQERGFGSLPSSTETNPPDQVKSISTAKAKFFRYAISDVVHTSYRAHNTGAYFLKQSLFQDDCKTLAVIIRERGIRCEDSGCL